MKQCEKEGCDNEVYHSKAKYCHEHSNWSRYGKRSVSKKQAKRGGGQSERRLRLVLTIDELAQLLEKLRWPAIEVTIKK